MEISIEEEIVDKYRNANSRLVLLDYDGTLVNHTSVPYITRLSEHLFNILIKIVSTPQTELIIITGRSHQDIDKILDNLQIDIIAEHGAMIKENGIWKNRMNDNCSWMDTIIPILNQLTIDCPKSFVERKSYSLTWHYRNAESQSGFDHSRELIKRLEGIIHFLNLKILDGNSVVEIMPKEVGKGKAVKKLFEQNKYDFTLSIGDDVTDEEMFEYFLHIPNAFTFKVGKGDSYAKYKLAGINDVLLLLNKLSA